MSTNQAGLSPELANVVRQVPPPSSGVTVDSLDVKAGEGYSEKLVDDIEMIGEEVAGKVPSVGESHITTALRYLHSSRTIHQLVTDRNRAVGIYLAVASLLVTASSALLNARPQGTLMVPMEEIQRWCLPLTFGALAVLAIFIAFLLIRTRIGLLYEVAKMNALLGLPIGRVSRVSPLSIFFILQAMISVASGCSGALFSVFMIHLADPGADYAAAAGAAIGVGLAVALQVLHVATVCYTTSDRRLHDAEAGRGAWPIGVPRK
jgi:hypothetical protein